MTFYLLALTFFHAAATPLDCIESVCGSSSSLQSSFSRYFSPRPVCYSYRDIHDLVAQNGEPNYLVARVPGLTFCGYGLSAI